MTHVYNTRGCKCSLDTPDDERKHHSKQVEQPRNNKFSYIVASYWLFHILYLDARNHEYQMWYTVMCGSYKGWNLHGEFCNSEEENGKNKA